MMTMMTEPQWRHLDRCALAIRPRQPFVDWSNRFLRAEGKPDLKLGELCSPLVSNPYSLVVLVPECDDGDKAAAEYLLVIFPKIFEEFILIDELTSDRSLWPDTKDFRVFSDWFDVEIYSLVLDSVDRGPEADGD